ncbi:MAG: sugar nucleotide-binding protein, partial [Candidatus Methanoperedenaceae archaeon]|nr:sugar nucleotide-binding protein [Candidatus Methanoperedenaceae archaeon]
MLSAPIELAESFLITGASGLLGANLVLVARQYGKDVTAIYHQHKFMAPDVTSLQVDLSDKRLIDDLFEQIRPDWIIHCAAMTNVDWCEENPADAYRINGEISHNLAMAAHRIDAGFVYISTDSVFDGKRGFYSETRRFNKSAGSGSWAGNFGLLPGEANKISVE